MSDPPSQEDRWSPGHAGDAALSLVEARERSQQRSSVVEVNPLPCDERAEQDQGERAQEGWEPPELDEGARVLEAATSVDLRGRARPLRSIPR